VNVTLIALVTVATLLQLAVVPLIFPQPESAPMLPVALLAAWGGSRNVDQVWPAIIPAALLPGILSTERAGWYLLALIPVVLLSSAISGTPAINEPHWLRRVPMVAAVAALGTLGYVLVMAVVGGQLVSLSSAPAALVSGAIGSALLASLWTLVLSPRRPRQGLFA